MRAYSIGALIGMCVLTQSGRLLICACLLNEGRLFAKTKFKGALIREEALIGRRELNQIITAWT